RAVQVFHIELTLALVRVQLEGPFLRRWRHLIVSLPARKGYRAARGDVGPGRDQGSIRLDGQINDVDLSAYVPRAFPLASQGTDARHGRRRGGRRASAEDQQPRQNHEAAVFHHDLPPRASPRYHYSANDEPVKTMVVPQPSGASFRIMS